MANTLNLGNGNWATKEDFLLAYNSENNNYKPLPFDFSRASSATRVNKDGLIETVGGGQARIDYTDNSKGALLLEPSRSNIITYSEDFSEWDKNTGTTINTNNAISPNGTQNATSIVSAGTGSRVGLNVSITSGTTYTLSVYLKNNGGNTLVSIGSHGTTQLETVNINNEWNRYTTTFTASSTTTSSIRIVSSGSNINLYAFGAQLEQGSYATSYIPTQGGVETRLAESCSNGGNEQVINSTEGVLYAEISSFKNGGIGDRAISISDGSTQNAIQLLLHNTANRINFRLKSGGSLDVNISDFTFEQNQINKIACKYKSGDYALWINGEERVASSSSSLPTGLSVLAFDDGSLNYFYGNVKDVKLYNTALTDQELQALTTI